MFNYPYWSKGIRLERKLYLRSPTLQKMVSSSTLQLYTKTLWSLGAVINLLMMTTIKVEYYTLKAYNDVVDKFMSTLSWVVTIISFFCLCIWFGYSYRINRARNIVLWKNFHPT
jgi:vacuolar-type H+-ATPase subunit I/STV1